MSEISRTKKSVTKPLLKGVGGIKLSCEAWFSGVVIPVAFALVADIYLPTQSSHYPHTPHLLGLVGTYFFSSPLLATPRLQL